MSETYKLESISPDGKTNRNTEVRIQSAVAQADKQVEALKSMDGTDAKSLISTIRAEAKILTAKSQLKQLLSGGEIPDKAMALIEENQPIEYVNARAEGARAVSRADDTGKVDKDGKRIMKIVWYIPDAVAVKKALNDKKNPMPDGEEKEGADKDINNLELARDIINHRKTAMTQWVKAAKIVKRQEVAAIHEQKKTKSINIYALGQKLLAKAQPVQQVVQTVTA